MPPRQVPVDFGVLPYSVASGSQRSVNLNIAGNHSNFESFPPHQRLGLQLAEAFPLKMEWTCIQWSRNPTVLDYQCGTGLLSQIVSPYVQHIIGIDPSRINVDEYNRRASSQGFYPPKACGYVGDFSTQHPDPILAQFEHYTFDVAMIGIGFYQCPSPTTALLNIVRKLKVGGTLLIIDYAPIHNYPVSGQYQRRGFTMPELHNMLLQHILDEVDVVPLTSSRGNIIMDNSGQWHVVIAKGVKRWSTY